jgi:precorrin-6Y C5,15-methyltransferase (decarboxylating)
MKAENQMDRMQPVHIVGLGLSPGDLTPEHLKLIDSADILVGGQRLLDYFPDSTARKKEINRNIKEMINFIQDALNNPSPVRSPGNNKSHSQHIPSATSRHPRIVVLASGDPLFFGIGSLLVKRLGKQNVIVHSNISSVAAAFAAIKESWQDATVISLHGRKPSRFFYEAITTRDKMAILTDPVHHPAQIASYLMEAGQTRFHMCVLEQLGSSKEKIHWYPVPVVAQKAFSNPNIVILMRDTKRMPARKLPPLYPGMPDCCFEHQQGLITKAEVRAVSLSKLQLHASNHILWDLGAGSGSVAIEAARLIPTGKIVAVEKRTERIEHIRANRQRFGIRNLDVIQAELPQGLNTLPKPDRIFIGGGGPHIAAIIQAAARSLPFNGVMVINTVLLKTITIALETLENEGFETDITEIQVSRGRNMPFSQRLEALNPVWIISGVKSGKESA